MPLLKSPSGWARQDVGDQAKYQAWLALLKDGDEVLLQEFLPPRNSCMHWPVELWRFQRYRVHGSTIVAPGDSVPVNRAEGYGIYWNSDRAAGEVFPDRLVPIHHELLSDSEGDVALADKPLYEPLFYGGTRYVFVVDHGKERHKALNWARREFPQHYQRDVDEGVLLHCFSGKYLKPENMPKLAGLRWLYSEDLPG